MKLQIITNNQVVKEENQGIEKVEIDYSEAYEPGDKVKILLEKVPALYRMQLDDSIGEVYVYMTKNVYTYEIPYGEQKSAYPKDSFQDGSHHLYIEPVFDQESYENKNLAYNPYDQKQNCGCYPHVSANTETPGQSAFAARSIIDGMTDNHGHGIWPFTSWGINKRSDARIQIEFGRKIEVEQILIWLRADFPHDSWWVSGELEFSDGSHEVISFLKTDQGQQYTFKKKTVEWVALSHLKKAEDESLFPSLTQIKVYGGKKDEN